MPSTAGTTASVAFVRHGKIYTGHVGDSGIVLGYQEDGEKCWRAKALTEDHKPESKAEQERINKSGGKVMEKSGIHRVVWNRPRIGRLYLRARLLFNLIVSCLLLTETEYIYLCRPQRTGAS